MDTATTKIPPLKYIAYPNSHGVEWTDEVSGTTYQLARGRPGGDAVLFGTRAYTTVVVNPERFGPLPTDRKSFIAYATAFITAAGDES